MEKRKIAILGSTGSIGTQTLDVVRRHRDLFEITLLSANNSADALIAQALEFEPAHVVICNEAHYGKVSEALQNRDIQVYAGMESLCGLVGGAQVDVVVGAMVGFSGLRPTLAALEAGKVVALANKETLVAAGALVTRTMRAHGAAILPVDSEHSAIFQCLLAGRDNAPTRLILTASGGPFRDMTRQEIEGVTFRQALRHPNWNMGAKVTIDSSTMMNKGFEVIEARWLFDMPAGRIDVLVHPESVVHSMVEFADGAVIAQLGCPDMRQPIGFALGFPTRLEVGNQRLDLARVGSLHFREADMERFPCLGLAYGALRRGGNATCALNAANEVAVDAFLHERIGFYDISRIVEQCLSGLDFAEDPSLDDIFETHAQVSARARELL